MAALTPDAQHWAQLGVWDDTSRPRSALNDLDMDVQVDPRPLPGEVLDMDKSLEELETQLAQLRADRELAMANRALIRRIPAELLTRVFELGTHESPALSVAVSLVSQQWRKLALSTPSLWSYIVLDGEWGYGRTAQAVRKFACYLYRSMESMLWVNIDLRFVDTLEESQVIMDLLEPHLHRCFHFRLSVPDWDWMIAFQSHCSRLRARVEELTLRTDPADIPSDNAEQSLLLTGEYPHLQMLKLEQTPLTSVRADLPALQRFRLTCEPRYHSSTRVGVSLRTLLDRLRESPSILDLRLQSAQLLLDGTEDVFHLRPSVLPLPNLTHLSLCCVDSSSIVLLTDALLLPALQRLSVHVDHHTVYDLMQWLPRISSANSSHSVGGERMPSLRQLDLRAISADGTALPPFIRGLHQLPQLTALSISSPHGGNLGSKFFALLARELDQDMDGGAWLLPRLEALCVHNCADIVGYELLEVVRARYDAAERYGSGWGRGLRRDPRVRALKFLKIEQCYAFEHEVLDLLRPMVDTKFIL